MASQDSGRLRTLEVYLARACGTPIPSVGAMAASSSEATLPPQSLTGLPAVEAYLQERHKGTWHITLHNHAPTRPKVYGGPLVTAVTKCKTFTRLDDTWLCSVHLPNSFQPGDGLELTTEGQGKTKDEASENACRKAMAHLLMRDPSKVILRPAHWAISPQQLLVGMPRAGTMDQALPIHVPARHREAGSDAATLTPAERDDRVAELVRECLRAHGGTVDPSRISHRALGLGPADARVYARLNKLLGPGQLRWFVERHPESAWHAKDPKGMIITWETPPEALPEALALTGVGF